jgi:hypothetical protein
MRPVYLLPIFPVIAWLAFYQPAGPVQQQPLIAPLGDFPGPIRVEAERDSSRTNSFDFPQPVLWYQAPVLLFVMADVPAQGAVV